MTAATRNEKHIRSASQVLYLALELAWKSGSWRSSPIWKRSRGCE